MTTLREAAERVLRWLDSETPTTADAAYAEERAIAATLRSALAEPTVKECLTAEAEAALAEPVRDRWKEGVIEGHLREREYWLAQQAKPEEPAQDPAAKVELMPAGGNAGLAAHFESVYESTR